MKIIIAFKIAENGFSTLKTLAEQNMDNLANIEWFSNDKASDIISARNIFFFDNT